MFFAWELLGLIVSLVAVTVMRVFPNCKGSVVFLGPFFFCLVRWFCGWLFGGPHEVYTTTVSFLLYLPFLVCLSLMFGFSKSRWLMVGFLAGFATIYGGLRPELSGTVLHEWRIGPSIVGAIGLLAAFFVRWMQHFGQLHLVHSREEKLSLQIEEMTLKNLSTRMDSLSRFSGTMAHELNNLLTIIYPLSQSLSEDLEDEVHRQDAEDILEASLRVKSLSEQLLVMTNTSSSLTQSLDLGRFLSTNESAFHEIVTPHCELEVDFSSEEILTSCSANELRRLFSHLLKNACEASTEGQKIKLTLSKVVVSGSHHMASLTVEDFGHGISPGLLARVFEPFVSSHPQKGRGMGLAEAYTIVNRNGGMIKLTNKEGGGVISSILLPLLPSSSSENAVLAPEDAVEDVSACHLLLVDDEPVILRALKRGLSREGFTVTSTNSSIDALNLIISNSQAYDLIISDVRMPDLTGPEMIAEARLKVAELPAVLFITGHIDEQSALDFEFSDEQVLFKPFSTELLSKKVKRILRRSAQKSLI